MTDGFEPFDPEMWEKRRKDIGDLLSLEDSTRELREVKHDFAEILSLLQQQIGISSDEIARRLQVEQSFYTSFFTIGFFGDTELKRVMSKVRQAFPKDQIMAAVDAFYEQPVKPNPLLSVFTFPPEIEAQLPARPDTRPPRRTALLQYLFASDEVR